MNTSTNPHCPVHVGTPMKAVEMRRPRFVMNGAREADGKVKTRVALKCPVDGCRRVALLRPEAEDEDFCDDW